MRRRCKSGRRRDVKREKAGELRRLAVVTPILDRGGLEESVKRVMRRVGREAFETYHNATFPHDHMLVQSRPLPLL